MIDQTLTENQLLLLYLFVYSTESSVLKLQIANLKGKKYQTRKEKKLYNLRKYAEKTIQSVHGQQCINLCIGQIPTEKREIIKSSLVSVTFSQFETKISTKTHIRKFEILQISG